MAAPDYTTDLADIIAEMPSTTGWTLISSGGGGANSMTAPETDDFIQGANSISRNPFSSSIRGMLYAASPTVASGAAVFFWTKADVSQALGTKAAGGIQLCIGNATTDFKAYYTDGKDTYQFGGWKCYPIDPAVTQSASVGTPTGTINQLGVRWNVPSTGPSRGFPFKIDALRHGRELRLTQGDAGGYATFDGVATHQGDLTRQWGLFQFQNGVYLQQGAFIMGLAGTAVDFRDSNRGVFIAPTDFVTANFNEFEVRNAASRVDWTNISIQALGTVSKGRFVMTDNADVNIDSCTFTDMNTFAFLSNASIIGTTFRRCGQITLSGATLTNSAVSNSTAATAVLAATPAGAALISGTDFISAGTGHAIEITGTADNFALTNNTYTGYAASDGSTGNEAVFVNIAEGSLNLTVSGGSTPSVRTAGCTVIVVTSSRTIKVAVTKVGGVVTGAKVYLAAADGGPFPSGADPDDIVTISSSGTIATVNHTAHGMATNDKINIDGITNKIEDNNGVHPITKINDNSYSYTTTDTGSTTYTGTIKVTFVFLKGYASSGTNSNEISISRTIPSNQPVIGWARKASEAPYYKEGAISGTVSSTGDTTFSPVLISDD